MRKAIVKKRTVDRRKKQMGYQREFPECEACRKRKAKMKTIGIIPYAIFICADCLKIYEAKGKPFSSRKLT